MNGGQVRGSGLTLKPSLRFFARICPLLADDRRQRFRPGISMVGFYMSYCLVVT
jgi:hypothetical protein